MPGTWSDSRARHPPATPTRRFRPGDAACRASADRERHATQEHHGRDRTRRRGRRLSAAGLVRAVPAANGCRGARPAAHDRPPRRGASRVHLGDVRRRRLLARPLARRAPPHAREHRRRADGAPHLRRLVARRGEPPRPRVPRRGHHELPRPARRPAERDRSRRGHPAISTAPPSWCSSSTACRRSGSRFAQVGIPGLPGATRIRERPRPERVAVAAFPNGHPRSRGARAGRRHAAREGGRRRQPRDHAAVLRTPTTTSASSTRQRRPASPSRSCPASCP